MVYKSKEELVLQSQYGLLHCACRESGCAGYWSKWEENTHGVAIAEIFKELGLNKSDDKRLRLCVLRTQYLYNYRVRTDQYVREITILHIVCIVLCCTAIVQHCAAMAQSAVIMSNAQSYDSCAVMTLTVHVSCTYWDDRYYRVHLYLIYDR